MGQRFWSILVELHGRSLAGLQCQLVHLQVDPLPSFTSKFFLFLYLSYCLSSAVFLSSPSFSVCLSVSLSFSFYFSAHLLTYGGRPGIVLTYLQLCSSPPTPDSFLFPVLIRMRHSPKLYTLNLTDIFRPALIFHSAQLRHLFETLCFLILLSGLAYETIALLRCK